MSRFSYRGTQKDHFWPRYQCSTESLLNAAHDDTHRRDWIRWTKEGFQMSPYFVLNELDNIVGLRHQRNLKSFLRIFGRALFNLQTLMFIQNLWKIIINIFIYSTMAFANSKLLCFSPWENFVYMRNTFITNIIDNIYEAAFFFNYGLWKFGNLSSQIWNNFINVKSERGCVKFYYLT